MKYFRRKKRETERRLFDDNGKALNVNQAEVDFKYDDSHPSDLVVELMLFKVRINQLNFRTVH